jgi:hypothetical protein
MVSEGVTTMTDEPVYEAYSFVCLNCGHGWECAYELRLRTDLAGTVHVSYYLSGVLVPSPLSNSSCGECGGHHIRILRPGRVASAATAPATRQPDGAAARRPDGGEAR